MRISDWSSDVCSSDLYSKDKSDPRGGHRLITSLATGAPVLDNVFDSRGGLNDPKQDIEAYGLAMNVTAELSDTLTLRSISAWRKDKSATPIDFDALPAVDVDVPGFYFNEQISQEFQLLYEGRSEEHTSELQSLMRIS